MIKKIEISHRTVVFTAFFILGLWFLFLIRDLILGLFVAFLLMAILEPMVNVFTKIRIPRGISILLSYTIFIGFLAGAIAFIVPPLVEQTTNFVSALPVYLSNIGIARDVSQEVINGFIRQLGGFPGEVIKFALSLFSNILSVVMVLAFSVYMIVARDRLGEILGLFFGDEQKKELEDVVIKIETRIGQWVTGEIFLMLLVGSSTFVGLSLLGIPFALPLAILAGILEIVPNLGPTIAAIPSTIIGLGISPITGLGAAGLAILIQQIENYVFVPKVMQKSVGVSPLITLISLAIGVRLAGVIGMIISVPTVITAQIIIKHYFIKE